jgi:hypothetical protein
VTGHGAHGATVEWAGVIGRPSEFTREWAYTSLSRARGCTRVYVIAEATEKQPEREAYSPSEPTRTTTEALDVLALSLTRRAAECLSIDMAGPQELAGADRAPSVPLPELAGVGAELASRSWASPPPPEIRGPAIRRMRGDEREQGMER